VVPFAKSNNRGPGRPQQGPPGTNGHPALHPDALKRRIAITSWETSDNSWKATITTQHDPEALMRYRRLNRLMNAVLRSRESIDYVVFPELSIPSRWFSRIASKLRHRRISLIAGVEYLPHPSPPLSNKVANQVWASLVTDFLVFPSSIVYRQDKEEAAPHEESELWNVGGKIMAPLGKVSKSPVLHGDFHFGILVCNELTNAGHRSEFRGEIDALFVPEWNQDTETFSFLVEAAAHDIHAYIVQCNNRRYGDSRIRGPLANSWERDIVRIKGGIEDYFVIGEIDVMSLRRFQSAHRSPAGPFKPVPTGFVMGKARQTLP
jgi:hypothetical protein